MTSLNIGIGSTNPTKIEAVKDAVIHAHRVNKITNSVVFTPVEAPSGVSAQPFSEEETRAGALNRAKAVLATDSSIDRAFGLEGGVVEMEDGLYSTVWVCVADRSGASSCVNGLRFRLADNIADGIRAGEEMGLVMDKLSGASNTKHAGGMIGIVTNGVVTRSEGYGSLARLAYGLFLTNFQQSS